MAKQTHWYLIAYDITEPKRIQRVHKFLKKKGGLPLQKSVFAWMGRDSTLQKLIKSLRKRLDEKQDDLRIYPIASLQAIDLWGKAKNSPLLTEAPPKTPWQRLKRWVQVRKGRTDD
jgi:CRISPR-associated endonuclease Cas2